ncbi:MFS transporter [Chloroflexi bacterium TSY]|nr:MFS transporter [Chloroflexi bacterium TSY]
MNRYLSLLKRNPDFRSLWFASIVTLLGDWFNTISTIVLINRYTDSGMAVAGLFLLRMLPPFLLSPIAGLVADRFSRKTIMIISDLLRVLIVLGFLLVDSAAEAWLVYLLTALQFSISTFFYPASSAILPNLLDRKEDLLLANTLGSITWSAMLALGAALGGITAAVFGVYTALVLDAMTFALSAALIGRIRLRTSVVTSNAHQNDRTALLGGLRYAIEKPQIGIVTLVKALGSIGSVDIIMAAFASTLFIYGDGGALGLGMMMTASGIGAVLGPLIANRFTPETEQALRRGIGLGFAAVVLGWIFMGQSGVFVLVLAAILLRSMGTSTNWTYSSVLLQMTVPNHVLGRVIALDEAIRTLTASISILLTGYAIDSLGVPVQTLTWWLGGVSLVPLGFWMWTLYKESRAIIVEEMQVVSV